MYPSTINDQPSTSERETRCYAITGAPAVLDHLEEMLRRIEWVGERGATRLVSAFVDGRGGARVSVRVLASWVEEGEEGGSRQKAVGSQEEELEEGWRGEEEGMPLRRLPDEDRICPCYIVDVVAG